MRLDPKLWRHFGGSQLIVDAGVLVVLGGVEALILAHPGILSPLEGALLVAGVGFLLILGRRAIAWPRAVPTQAFLPEWAERALAGERRPTPPPHDLSPEQLVVARALSQAMEEILALREELAFLQRTVREDWGEIDAELDRLERVREEGLSVQARMLDEMAVLGRELKERLDAPELAARVTLRTRGLGVDTDVDRALFKEEVGTLRQGLERLGELVDQVKDSVPRLRREAEQLTALGFSAGRRASRLWAAIQGLGGHSQRLLESSRARTEGLTRLRELGDHLREEGEGLRRRLAQLRSREDARSAPLGRIEESLRAIDQVAQQTGLLAVNAAILAQDQRGSRGFQVIGSKIRLLAEQTALGTAEVSRGVAEHRQDLDTEVRRLEELQEAVDQVLAALSDFQSLHTQLDHQGTELERSIESHLDQVKSVESTGASAVEALQQIQARADAVESAVARQRAAEQETGKEKQEILGRLDRVEEHALRLMRSEESALTDLWLVLDRHAQLRGSAPFRAFRAGRFQGMSEEMAQVRARELQNWHRLDWSRAAHRRALRTGGETPLEGRRDGMGRLQLLLLRRDAFGLPRPSALSDLRPDLEGRHWRLELRSELRGQDCALALLVAVREALAAHWITQPDLLMDEGGVRLDLGMALPGLPELLAGLEVCFPLPEGVAEPQWAPMHPQPRMVQRFLWMGAGLAPEVRSHLAALLHDQVAHLAQHEALLPGAARADRIPCARCARGEHGRALMTSLPVVKALRTFAVEADPEGARVWTDAMGLPSAEAVEAPVVLGAVSLPFPRPEALLLALVHPSAGLGFDEDASLRQVREQLLREVLAGGHPDPDARAWELLDRLVAEEFLAPLPG